VKEKDLVVLGPYRVLDQLKANDLVRATKKDAPKDDKSVAAISTVAGGHNSQ
jgi:hypothetical protein